MGNARPAPVARLFLCVGVQAPALLCLSSEASQSASVYYFNFRALDCLWFLCLCVCLGACPQTSPQRAEEEDSSWRKAAEWQPALPQPESQSTGFILTGINGQWKVYWFIWQQRSKASAVAMFMQETEFSCNVTLTEWLWQTDNIPQFSQLNSIWLNPPLLCFTQDWLIFDWIETFPLTSRSRKAVWHCLLKSAGISNKFSMACAQQDTAKPGRTWQITTVAGLLLFPARHSENTFAFHFSKIIIPKRVQWWRQHALEW